MFDDEDRSETFVFGEFHKLLSEQVGARLITVRAEDLRTLLKAYSDDQDEFLKLLNERFPDD